MERRWLRFYDEGVPRHLEYPAAPAHHLLANSAALWPDRICTNFMGRRLSYGRLEDLASRLAAGAAGAGLKPGDRVVLLLPNCPQFLIAAYGLWAAGAVLVPVNPLSSVRELHFFLSHTEASSVVTIPLFLRKAGEAAAGTAVKSVVLARLADYLPFPYNVLAGWGEGKRVRAPYLPPAIRLVEFSDLVSEPPGGALNESGEDVEAPAAILYSGGTTGTAKGVVLSHANLVANARQVAAWGHLEEGGVEKMLAVLPLFHGFGMSTHMNAPVLAGMEVILVPRFSAKGVARTIHKERPTFFCGVPAMFAALGSAPNLPRCDFSSLKGIFVGAAPLPPAVKQDFETRTGGRMIEGYGLTEAVTAIMANPYRGLHKTGSIGIPFPDTDVRIVGLESGEELAAGETGEIAVKGPSVMQGYFKNPELTRETIRDGWLFTGDIGWMDEDGYFYITDRKKDIIITGGFNVLPGEIDELASRHPKILEAVAVGLPDPFKGERIKLYAVPRRGAEVTSDELIRYLRENLAPYKVPDEIEFRSDLPRNMIGKVLRRVLREEEGA